MPRLPLLALLAFGPSLLLLTAIWVISHLQPPMPKGASTARLIVGPVAPADNWQDCIGVDSSGLRVCSTAYTRP